MSNHEPRLQCMYTTLTERRVDCSWRICVDVDAVLAIFHRRALGQATDRELRRAVDRLFGDPCQVDQTSTAMCHSLA